ncbi:hypothetical protein A3B32_03725 [Candidatus Uhrbacteria bacterium RIFCSPLOWO2_01_FULL_53_9]|uniref:Uncharacterized protein n=3 Tax=Candidatus Uhriibacteriota TaxID=1752732 RepID=A0A1F7UYB7_9BACT|nr:MAG: hypothetical protein A3C17_04580 [Candidatus Uhrbacteria bacterium RIFCSPHIGHO2_02_FULL_53_13]OGL83260.1 MAG: hypothetical protein A3B32_03725 [Candidatus Uhrbacteria bacterium RIFCSPLOWO2_01_FULL_53_9]OGL89594.1 MAG: hypothetical protein A3I45_00100 [Candidatus Uhrbacteria bacterium RIFCSPLOWO2_02_FULL_53_10]
MHPDALMRAAGYAPFRDPKTGDHSYVRRMTSEFYPRFHCYVEDKPEMVRFSLHLDQKKPSYRGTAAHGGEYDGPTVEREMERMKQAFRTAR